MSWFDWVFVGLLFVLIICLFVHCDWCLKDRVRSQRAESAGYEVTGYYFAMCMVALCIYATILRFDAPVRAIIGMITLVVVVVYTTLIGCAAQNELQIVNPKEEPVATVLGPKHYRKVINYRLLFSSMCWGCVILLLHTATEIIASSR